MRMTVKDVCQSDFECWLDGELFKWAVAVDTDAGAIYGMAHEGDKPCMVDGDWAKSIYRGRVELRLTQRFTEKAPESLKRYVNHWIAEGGTPLAEFEQFIKPWQKVMG